MNSTRPLAKTGNDVERLLLAAGAGERPDAESVRKAARGLGLVPRAALVAAALGVAFRASRWTSFATWSSVSLVGVAGIALVARAEHATPRAAVSAAQVAATAQHAVPATTGAAPSSPSAVEEVVLPRMSDPAPAVRAADPARPVVPEERGHAHRVAAATGGPIAPLSSAQVDRLREQAEALDSARTLLASGDATGALGQLADYNRRFAGGALREEALLLRIESLARVGDRSTASALARRFLKAYPASVHADRVAALLREWSEERGP